jgi:hypothetical protein
MEEDYFLIYVNRSGLAIDGYNSYDFLFAKDPTIVYGEGWNVIPSSICSPEEKLPHSSTYDLTKRINTQLKFGLAQNNSCFAMQDCIDGVICLAYEDITDYDEYPSNRLVLNFGETFESVERKLDDKDIILKDL